MNQIESLEVPFVQTRKRPARFVLLGIPLDLYATSAIAGKIKQLWSTPGLKHIATVNPEFLVEARKNEPFAAILNRSQLNICDGFGITLWAKLLHKTKIPRTTGVQVAQMLCGVAARENQKIALIGGFGVAKIAAEYIQKKYPTLQVVFAQDGHPNKTPQAMIDAEPDIILVAFGAPKQAFWIANQAPEVASARIAIGVGGTFDFWAGKIPRAPRVLQRLGLEWFWRLITQPSRWRRIFNAVFVFSFLAIKEKMKQKKNAQ
jgi:N-acetylglucosaminyldiphosphoundecaprenol N-acetyl-beta-D-mannosaminyltransferase